MELHKGVFSCHLRKYGGSFSRVCSYPAGLGVDSPFDIVVDWCEGLLMYIGFEIDGMLCSPSKSMTDFEEIGKQVLVEEGRVLLTELKAAGHHIVLYTRRDASTMMATEMWLVKNKIPYDKVVYNRLHTVVMFFSPDARAFTGWGKVREELLINGAIKEKHADTASAEDGGAAEKDSKAGCQGKEELDAQSGGAGPQGPPPGGTVQTLK